MQLIEILQTTEKLKGGKKITYYPLKTPFKFGVFLDNIFKYNFHALFFSF